MRSYPVAGDESPCRPNGRLETRFVATTIRSRAQEIVTIPQVRQATNSNSSSGHHVSSVMDKL